MRKKLEKGSCFQSAAVDRSCSISREVFRFLRRSGYKVVRLSAAAGSFFRRWTAIVLTGSGEAVVFVVWGNFGWKVQSQKNQ